MCLPVSSLSLGGQIGHSLVLTPLRNDLTVRFMFFSAQGRAQQYKYNFISFHKLPPLCDLTLSVPREPTFLVIWLEIQAFSFLTVEHTSHNCVNLFGQVARGSRIKETGILPFLLGLQYLPKNRVFLELLEPAWVLLPLPPVLLCYCLRAETRAKGKNKKGIFFTCCYPQEPSFLLLRPKIEGLSGAFSLCIWYGVLTFWIQAGDYWRNKKWETCLQIWRCSILFFFSLSACYHLHFQVLRYICPLFLVAFCGRNGVVYFILTYQYFKSNQMICFPCRFAFFPPQKVNILGR